MKLHFFLTIGALLLLAGCAASGEQAPEYRQITMDEALALMETEPDFLLLDVRTKAEFTAGHIPGAVNIPNEAIGTQEIPELPDKDRLILVYCRSGNRSKQAAGKLAELGYTNIVEIGGIRDWTGETVAE